VLFGNSFKDTVADLVGNELHVVAALRSADRIDKAHLLELQRLRAGYANLPAVIDRLVLAELSRVFFEVEANVTLEVFYV